MIYIYLLIVAYGITFGLQHKVPFIWKKSAFVDEMLGCSYCTGFHAGWITWILYSSAQANLLDEPLTFALFVNMILFAFAAAAFSYLMDVVSQWLELSVQK